MKALFVHPGPLLYTKVFLRLEPFGLELVAEAARRAGHTVQLIDLQVEDHADYHRMIAEWRPDFIAFSCNYLANVPEIVDLAKATKAVLPRSFIFVGGHSASFTARAILEHGEGAIDCVLKGEGEAGIVTLLEAVAGDRAQSPKCPAPSPLTARGRRRASSSTSTTSGRARSRAPPPQVFHRRARSLRLDRVLARLPMGLLVLQRLDVLRPQLSAASARNAWSRISRPSASRASSSSTTSRSSTRSTALPSARRSPARASARSIYLETRGDVLLAQQGGVPVLEEDRPRHTCSSASRRSTRRACASSASASRSGEFRGAGVRPLARHQGGDQHHRRPGLGRGAVPRRARLVHGGPGGRQHQHQHALSGHRDLDHRGAHLCTRDYRLFDIQHAVLPTKLPLRRSTGSCLQHPAGALPQAHELVDGACLPRARALQLLIRGQTNFVRGIMHYNKVYNLEKMLSDHAQPVSYEIPLPPTDGESTLKPPARSTNLYIHAPSERASRHIENSTESGRYRTNVTQ